MSEMLDETAFVQIDTATTEEKKALMRLAADRLRVSQSSTRFHAAMRKVIDEGCPAKKALTDMVKFEDRARQDWVDHCLQPWCDRHGLTLKQGLSVLFDDDSFNPADPSKDRVTRRDVLGWSGQQNDFALRLMADMKATPPAVASNPEIAKAPGSQPADAGLEIHGFQRWDVMQGVEDALPGEPTYVVSVRSGNGQVAIDVMPPEMAALMAQKMAGAAVEDSDPRWALPCLEVTLEVDEGLPCVHVHGGASGELAQSVFALPDAKVAIRAVADPGMKDAVIAVPDSYLPDFEEVHARFAAVNGIDLAAPADLEAPQSVGEIAPSQ